ncbi:MAG: zinc-binding dehydrogenase, partial [Actinomycetota bacterium]|nr:zinc-binding dehydrogenase [Actinomycetota bacterium]
PKTLSLEVASLLGCSVITGLGAVLDRAGVPEGSSVVVVGAGGVGLSSIQGARLSGARPIIASDISAAKRELALRFGATHALDASSDHVASEVRVLTEGRGADYVFVTVGRVDAIERGLTYVRRGGTVVVVGMPAAGETFGVVAVDLVHDDIRLFGSKMGSTRLEVAVPRIVELYESGQLKLDELVTGRFRLEEINEAIMASRDETSVRNLIVFEGA